MANEQTFVVEKTCPVCGKTTRVVKVKSRLVAKRIDDDYCCHYEDFNPYFYTIWACEHCGYAADEKSFLARMPDRHRESLAKFLKEKRVSFLFSEKRGIPEAIASYYLAMYCAEVISAPLYRMAGMALRMAWIFRICGVADKEREWTLKAINYYERSLMSERYPVDNLQDSTVMYLIAVLFKRMGDVEHATAYLSRLINDKDLKLTNQKVYNDARNIWQDMRAEKSEESPASKTKKVKVKKKV